MKKRLLPILLALCMVLALLPTAFAADLGSGEFNISVDGIRAYSYAYEVAEQVNQLRAGLGLSQLVIDPVLMETAMHRAAECAVYYSHTRPNGTRCYTAFPSRYGTSAENIAAGYTSPAAVMNGWTNSSGHYANMTEPSVNAIGVGCFYANGRYYWAQCFTGGAYESSSVRETDQMGTDTFAVVKDYFSPVGDTSIISLQVGESYQLPVYTRNPGFYNYATAVSGVSGATLSAGTNLVRLDSNTLTVTVLTAGSGTVTLSLPSGDVLSFAVEVTGGGAGGFTDVPDWCAGAASWAAAEDVTQGVGNNRFDPYRTCTHVEILTMLYRAEGSPEPKAAAPFDVEFYFQDAVDWAYGEGIINDSFVPGKYCTRADAMKYVWQARGSQPVSSGSSFIDVFPGDDYAAAVSWAEGLGITNGTGGGSAFNPSRNCSRGEIVTFLHRTYVPEVRLK